VIYYRGNEEGTFCGKSSSLPQNAYYCRVGDEIGEDEHVAFDLDWFAAYLLEFPGGATTWYIIAHEWGHAVQDSWLENGGNDTWSPQYRMELNADCLAGVFLSYAYETGRITADADDAEAIWTALYKGGGPWLNPTDHGTREQRIAAFTDGFTLQDARDCRTRY
jgi:predicted metalloprotease